MKSLWKSLIQSTIVIGVSTCSTTALVADDTGPTGVVRISKPKSQNAAGGDITQVSAMQTQGGCVAAYAPPVDPGCSQPAANCSAMPETCCPAGTCDGYCEFPRRRMIRRAFRSGNGWDAEMQCDDGYCNYPRRGLLNRRWQGSGGWNSGMSCDDGSCNNGFGGGCSSNSCLSHAAMLDYFRCKFGYFIPTGAGGKGLPPVGHYSRVYPVNPAYRDPRDGQAYAAQGYGIPMAVPLAPVVGHTYDYGWGVPSSRLTPVSHPAY